MHSAGAIGVYEQGFGFVQVHWTQTDGRYPGIND
jgi:hypothetical protein